MQSLKEIIAALREEVGTALVSNKPLPGNVRLEADRVVVNLAFRVEHEADQAVAFDFGKDSATNRLSIEFRCDAAMVEPSQKTPDTSVAHRGARQRELADRDAQSVIRQLSQVFGAPGFDSSARATVFREAFENLSVQEVGALVESFSATGTTPPSDPVKRSIGLIRRICDAGPAGRDDSKKILATVFADYESASVLDLVSATWKNQQHWLD